MTNGPWLWLAMGEPELRFVVLLLLFAAAILLAAYLRLRLRISDRVQQQVARWQEAELERLKGQLQRAAAAEAGVSLERWRLDAEAEIRADAIRRSSAVVSGKVSEHLAPYLGSFPYNPKDARFLGTPVDLLVFDGLDEDDVREIVFLEIKTGGSGLTTRERRVRDAVLAGRVSWREFRVGGE